MAVRDLFISTFLKKHLVVEDTAASHVWQTGCQLYTHLEPSKMALEDQFLAVNDSNDYFLSSLPDS